MSVYFIYLSILSLIGFLDFKYSFLKKNQYSSFFFILVFAFLLIILIGFRHEVGGDWGNYINNYLLLVSEINVFNPTYEQMFKYYDIYLDNSFWEDMPRNINDLFKKEYIYWILNYIGVNGFGHIYFVNTICAIIYTSSLIILCRSMPYTWIAFMIAFPYLTLVVSQGYVRQSVSLSFFMISLVALNKNKELKFILWNILGFTFHFSNLFIAPLLLIRKSKFLLFILTIIFFLILIGTSLSGVFFTLLNNYILISYNSSGAFIRLLMNLIPGLILLLYHRKIFKDKPVPRHWIILALISIIFFVAYFISPSTAIIDRFGLYLIPLQIYVWTNLINSLNSKNGSDTFFVILLILYNFSIMYVWLFFSENSFAWVPYKNILFEIFFNNIDYVIFIKKMNFM